MALMSKARTPSRRPNIPLAFFGASPAFDVPLPLQAPHFTYREAVLGRLGSMLTGTGPVVEEFETRVADALDASYCVAASNTGAALELAVRGLDLGGEVILPAFMPISVAHTLQRQGITPVFCDIDARTRTLDPQKVRTLVTPRTTGIIAAHLWGQPCAVEALEELARERGLKLLLDARHAFGCMHRGVPIGRFGDAEVIGFDAGSPLYACDGAMVSTGDAALARRLRIIQNLGFDDGGASVCLGIDGHMNEVCAAVGLANLERVHDFIEMNRRCVARYDLLLADLAGIVVAADESMDQRNFQHAVVEVDQAAAGISRDALLEVLRAEGVLATRDYYPGGHRVEPYRLQNAEAWLRLQVTERLAERVLCLPAGAAVDETAVDRICAIIRCAVQHGASIMARVRPPARAGLKPPR